MEGKTDKVIWGVTCLELVDFVYIRDIVILA